LQVGVDPEDIIKILRLGKRNTDGASPRPFLIQHGSRYVKNLITESLFKIKYFEAKFQGQCVIVSHDMTKKQREECKALVADAKSKSESGDWVYKVLGSTRALEDNTDKKMTLTDSVEFFHRTGKNKSNKNNLQNTLSDSHRKFFGSVYKC